MKRTFLVGLSIATAFLAAACGGGTGGLYGSTGGSSSATPAAANPVAATPAPASSAPVAAAGAATGYGATMNGIQISIGSTALGQVLVDGSGRTIYLFEADQGTASACNSSACVNYWPPVVTTGTPQAGAGVNASLLGTATRKDGSTEVVYNGHPLYYFAPDKQAGDTKGQGVNAFGAPWYVLSPAGAKVG